MFKSFFRKKIEKPENNNKISGNVSIGDNCNIKNSIIHSSDQAEIIISDDVQISNYEIRVEKGTLEIGASTILTNGNNLNIPHIIIKSGELYIDKYSVIKCNISIRFGGKCKIGSYTAINEETILRCDLSLTIGNYCMISYEADIYDTNTHCSYPIEVRRDITEREFPFIGNEHERPPSSPVVIGNDCWIGKGATVLKGTIMENSATLGIKSLVSGKVIPEGATAVGNPAIILNSNDES